MKRLLFLLFALFISTAAYCQLEVKEGSFKEVPGFVNVNPDENYQLDDNDLPFAIIKVRTENINEKERKRLSFSGNMGTFINLEYKDGEVWVYLTAKYADYLKISHPDFSSIEFTIPFDLQPKKGYEMTLVNKSFVPDTPVKDQFNYLIVKADQPNAVIYIDGQYAGDGEAAKSFKVGETHQWGIECEMYYSENGSATIIKDSPITIEKNLRPAFGFLYVTSEPEDGATVFVDNKRVGETPCQTGKLASGEHKVRLMKEMYLTTEQTFIVTDGNTTQAVMDMTANFVTVNVTTDSQSKIYVDNEYKGTGSWNGRLTAGDHLFEAKKASHKTTMKNMTFAIGANESVVIPAPVPIYGTIDINSSPMGAKIIIDDQNKGVTPMVLSDILVGDHVLKLQKTGCTSLTKTISLDENNVLSINEILQTGREISITTDKSGDKIFIDSKYVGLSPLTTSVSIDVHDVVAVRGGNGYDLNALKSTQGVRITKKSIAVTENGGDDSVIISFPNNSKITIKKILFANVDRDGNIIDNYGENLVESKIKYIKPEITYDCTDGKLGNVVFYQTIKRAWNGTIIYGSSSPDYSTKTNAKVTYGKDKKLQLSSWGHSVTCIYCAGTYIYEVWVNDEMLISEKFIIQKDNVQYDNLKVKDVVLANYDSKVNVIDAFGSNLTANNIQYLRPKIKYDYTKRNSIYVVFYYKILKDGMLLNDVRSPIGFTHWTSRQVVNGKNNEVELSGWGSKDKREFSPGDYTIEIWAGDQMLFSKGFVLY